MARGNQLVRQWQLLKILQNHRYGISIDDLVEKVCYTRRTIERDLTILKEVNFPISSDTRDFGKKFWKLEPNFLNSDNLLIGLTEIVSMHLAKQLLAPLAGTHFGDGLEQFWNKIETLLPKTAIEHFTDLDETLYVKLAVKEDCSAQDKSLHIIRTAIAEQKVLKISYSKDTHDKAVLIEFHPYGVIFFGASLYVIGFSVPAQDMRTLKLQRITGAELTDKKFQKPEDFSLEHCVSGSFGIIGGEGKPITICCCFRDWAAKLIREQKWHKTQIIEKDGADEVVASFLLDNTIEFKRWILGFGAAASVIKPKALKNEIAQTLALSLENYK